MMERMLTGVGRALAAAAVALALVAAPPPASAQEEATRIGIERGAVPSPLTLEDVVQGAPVDLGKYIGHQPVLLEFWATWCENCRALHPRMLAAHSAFGERAAFFAVAVAVGQSPRTIRRRLEKEPVPWPTLWDADGAAVREFEVPATSYVVILDSKGRVAYTGLGPGQRLTEAVAAVLAAEGES